MGRLDGKVAIITGAAGGIGSATVRLMVAEGAAVVAGDINEEGVLELAAELTASGHRVIAQTVDVAREADVERLVTTAVEQFGRLDILHNNAAYGVAGDTDTVHTPDEVWQEMLNVIFFGTIYGCRHGIPAMIRTGGGSVINTSSGAASTGMASRPAYGAAKAAMETLTKYTATMYGRQGVRCNAIAPGFVTSPAALALFPAERLEAMAAGAVAPRLAEPADVAKVAVFLASDDSAYLSGQVIACNGGGAAGTRW